MMPPSPSRTKAEKRGRWGERWAALFLTLKFYRILEQRYKCPLGEIDLIAAHFGTLVFVEVKTRARADDLETALLAVNQRRITRAAQYFLAQNPHLGGQSARFDVIFLAPGHLPRHVRNAFQSVE